ncbi:MAG: DUF523 domain-containing protein [Gammaproteobacteria bacterium]|nr:DUF523 domain-containing protein [Gammaproteobacteria bacterium]
MRSDTLKPLVGISQCLLGDAVRYDGRAKTNKIVLEQLSLLFDLVPVCPEVEVGLPIPRPPVQLSGSIENPRLIGRDDPLIDVTDILQRYCDIKPAELKYLSGFIFKSRSPSCGLNSVPVFVDGECVTETSRGIFSKTMCTLYPHLVVIEDSELEDDNLLRRFIQLVTQTPTG